MQYLYAVVVKAPHRNVSNSEVITASSEDLDSVIHSHGSKETFMKSAHCFRWVEMWSFLLQTVRRAVLQKFLE